MGYMFAPKNHPDRPNAIVTRVQHTIGTGMTQRTCFDIKSQTWCSEKKKTVILLLGSRWIGHNPILQQLQLHSTLLHRDIGGLTRALLEAPVHMHIRARLQCWASGNHIPLWQPPPFFHPSITFSLFSPDLLTSLSPHLFQPLFHFDPFF